MAIIDLRGPEVLLREGFDEDGEKVKKKRRKATQNVVGEQSAIATLKWVISGLGPGECSQKSLANGKILLHCLA